MSLYDEQLIENGFSKTDKQPLIYATGVYLNPLKIEIEGVSKFIWVAHEFNDNTYLEDKIINPLTLANSIEELINFKE